MSNKSKAKGKSKGQTKSKKNRNKKNKTGYPEPGELVIATVQSIFKQGAFCTLDEYGGKRGMLHLSEISLKWVRNIRNYVKEGQKVVLLVLGVKKDRGHIDFSLRRVSDAQRKAKLQTIKKKQRSDKLLSMLAEELSEDPEKVNEEVGKELLRDYESVYDGLEAILLDNSIADELDIKEEWKKPLVELIDKSIKPPLVEITGYVELKNYAPNGIEIIKDALKKISDQESAYSIDVSYIAAPIYSINVVEKNYKKAEKVLKKAVEQGISYNKEHDGEGAFHRKLEELEK